jgi:SRSO17 transposase
MSSSHHITPEEAGPSLQEKGTWPLALFCLHQRLAPYFARPEPYHHALLYLQAVMSEIPRKNSWQIAEHGKQARPSGMQRLLSRAVWDDEGVRNEIRTLLVQTLSPPPVPPLGAHGDTREEILFPFPVIVVDETGIPKRGTHSAGVKVQYCGSTGRVENCQVGVVLTYVTDLGHALMDAALYIPEEWCDDPARRHVAHIPERVHFQTKPELAQSLLQRAISASLPLRWVVGDTVYGHSTDLRAFLHAQGLSFALAVPDNEVVCVDTVLGYRLGEVASIERLLPDGTLLWQRLSMSQGTKGERLFDWAIVPQVHRTIVDGCHFLVIRRCLDAPFQKAYYFVFAPPQTSLQTMVLAIGARWSIEVDLENAKDLGLDQYARAQLHRVVSPYYACPACLGVSALHLCPGPSAYVPVRGSRLLITTHCLDHFRSASSAGPSLLACSHPRFSDSSVVHFSPRASILGKILSLPSSFESGIACSMLSVFMIPADLRGMIPADFRGIVPAISRVSLVFSC